MKNNRVIPNWINGEIHIPKSNQTLEKFNPHTGLLDSLVVSSDKNDVSYNNYWKVDEDTWNRRKVMSVYERLKV